MSSAALGGAMGTAMRRGQPFCARPSRLSACTASGQAAMRETLPRSPCWKSSACAVRARCSGTEGYATVGATLTSTLCSARNGKADGVVAGATSNVRVGSRTAFATLLQCGPWPRRHVADLASVTTGWLADFGLHGGRARNRLGLGQGFSIELLSVFRKGGWREVGLR